MKLVVAVLLLILCVVAPAHAVNPEEMLKDPVAEARARKLSVGLRCLVCQNESIDDSNAPLARDLRLLVRERIVAGDSDQQVQDFMVLRYGQFVLLRPPVTPQTLLLYGAPFLVLGFGGLMLWQRSRQKTSGSGPSVLSPEEAKKLERILSK
jgi:cytochrome c-type biogenesis protein CcmH